MECDGSVEIRMVADTSNLLHCKMSRIQASNGLYQQSFAFGVVRERLTREAGLQM
jgi:hypothetical protein